MFQGHFIDQHVRIISITSVPFQPLSNQLLNLFSIRDYKRIRQFSVNSHVFLDSICITWMEEVFSESVLAEVSSMSCPTFRIIIYDNDIKNFSDNNIKNQTTTLKILQTTILKILQTTILKKYFRQQY